MKKSLLEKSHETVANWVSLILAGCMVSTLSYAGHGVGNGGDHIRATFMSVGRAVVQYLNEGDEGTRLRDEHRLDTSAMSALLSIESIEVKDEVLVDNGGSVVDAIGERQKITLAQDRWTQHFENERDVYFLVLHELLRALEINDDDYVISRQISPFPLSRRVTTRLSSTYPIITDTPLNTVIDVGGLRVAGTGCDGRFAGTFVDIDLERNVLGIAFRNFDIVLDQVTAARKNCTVILPIKAPVGKRLIVSQLDFSAKAILNARARASVAATAYFGASSPAPLSQSMSATELVTGRFLLRSPIAASTACDGEAGLLKVQLAGSLQKESGSLQSKLIGDYLTVSFLLEDCRIRR
jgi:hypothetical protein